MIDNNLNRRDFGKVVSTAALTTIGLSEYAQNGLAASGFSKVSNPTSRALNDVEVSAWGPVAVGTSGAVLHRSKSGWRSLLDKGVSVSNNSLESVAVSDDGRRIWTCGVSGTVGAIDPTNSEVNDYSQPGGSTAGFNTIAVGGGIGFEGILLGTGGGKVIRGDYQHDGPNWESPVTVGNGNSITSIDWHVPGDDSYANAQERTQEARLGTGSGEVYETTDGGKSWQNIGLSNVSAPIYSISSTGPSSATVATTNGRIYEYDGSSWTQTHNSGSNIYDIYQQGSNGLASGKGGEIHTKTDTGWSKNETAFGSQKFFGTVLSDTAYPDVVVGTNGTILERGSYNQESNDLRIASRPGSNSVDYELTVNGSVSLKSKKGTDDSIQSCSDGTNCYRVSGTLTAGKDSTVYAYSGDVSSLRVTGGTASDLVISINGERVSPHRIADMTWVENDSVPVSVTLHGCAPSDRGPIAVGGSGKLVCKNSSGGYDELLKNGPGSNGNNLYTAATTDDGLTAWMAGSSGVVGEYDITNDSVIDHTAPNNITNTWKSAHVVGDSGSELVYLGSGSGQLIIGKRSSGTISWSDPITPGDGSALVGIDFFTDDIGFICDTNGKAFKTTDGGSSWQTIGIDSTPGTPYDISARHERDLLVSGGSGYYYNYQDGTWTTRDIGGKTRYAVSASGDRSAIVGGSGQIYEKGVNSWSKTRDKGSTLRDTFQQPGGSYPAVAVGNSGTILEKSFKDNPF